MRIARGNSYDRYASSLRLARGRYDQRDGAAYNRRRRHHDLTTQSARTSSEYMQHENSPGVASTETEASLPLLRRPRALILTVFALALLFALIAPLAQLWRAGVTPLDAQACVWPRAPLVGQPAQIVITLPSESDRAAGSWTRAVVEWDMVSMRMGARRATTAPSSPQSAGQENAITIPLALNMAGAWAARVLLQAPGRPDWTSILTFTALGSDQAYKTPPPTGLAGCVEPPARADGSIGGAL